MAKNALGRGLGSLLGGSYEEASSPSPAIHQQQAKPQYGVPSKYGVTAPSQNTESQIPSNQLPSRERISMGRINASTGEIIDNTVRVEKSSTVQSETVRVSADNSDSSRIEEIETKNPEVLLIELIEPNENQPRINFKKEELDELAASIKKDGLLQPILVRPKDGKYEIIAGERRYRASKLAGLTEVPVRIKEADDEETLELALIENIQRSDLNPIEEAYAYRRLMEKKNLNQSQVAQMVSKGRSTVANAVRLLDLPEEAQKLLYEEKITAGHARAILSVPTPEGRMKLTQKLIDTKLSVREAENLARLMSLDPKKKKGGSASATPKSYKKVARTLHDKLNRTVKVKTSQGRNRIEIEFKDEEDLQRLFISLLPEAQKPQVDAGEIPSEE